MDWKDVESYWELKWVDRNLLRDLMRCLIQKKYGSLRGFASGLKCNEKNVRYHCELKEFQNFETLAISLFSSPGKALEFLKRPTAALPDHYWSKAIADPAGSGVQRAIGAYDCAWVLPWEIPYSPDDVELDYDGAREPKIKASITTEWREKAGERAKTLEGEQRGRQVRLARIDLPGHPPDKRTSPCFSLGPARYSDYEGTHHQLSSPERPFREARKECRENALQCWGVDLMLPSNFALHMAVISSDKKLMVRLRQGQAGQGTEIFPETWEASLGEFMHGPRYNGSFRHFDQNSKPSWKHFLEGAVAEELGIPQGEINGHTFKLYGFAVEYYSLGPKLLVVCRSPLKAGEIVEFHRKAKPDHAPATGADCVTGVDKAKKLDYLDLTPEGIMKGLRDPRPWSACSKLAAMLALLDLEGQDRDLRISKVGELYKALGDASSATE